MTRRAKYRCYDPATALGRARRTAFNAAARRMAERIDARLSKIVWERHYRKGRGATYFRDSAIIRLYACHTALLDKAEATPQELMRVAQTLAHEVWHGVCLDYGLESIEEGCVQLLALRDGRDLLVDSGLVDSVDVLALGPTPFGGGRSTYEREVRWVLDLAQELGEDPCALAESVLRDTWGLCKVASHVGTLIAGDQTLYEPLLDAQVRGDGGAAIEHLLEAVWHDPFPTQPRRVPDGRFLARAPLALHLSRAREAHRPQLVASM